MSVEHGQPYGLLFAQVEPSFECNIIRKLILQQL